MKETNKPTQSVAEKILDLARWAPSGDNTQVWQFEIIDDHHLVIHGRFISDTCVYDLQGHASEVALGALLETLVLAATEHGLKAKIRRRTDTPTNQPTFDVYLRHDPELKPHPLTRYIKARSVQRRPLRTRPLTLKEKEALEGAVGEGYRILWLEGFGNRLRAALLMFRNAGIRLTMPEAYEEHKKTIEWRTRYSEDRIPDQALGTDPVLTCIMEWAMKSWRRINALNRYAAGTWLARIEMDLIPGLACGAHFAIIANQPPVSADDYTAAGGAVQRFWLTVTQLGLQLQPETTPLIFRSYIVQDIQFTQKTQVQQKAKVLIKPLSALLGEQGAKQAIFMGRIGAGPAPRARSLRRPLKALLVQATSKTNK